jgi:hypothetical protein
VLFVNKNCSRNQKIVEDLEKVRFSHKANKSSVYDMKSVFSGHSGGEGSMNGIDFLIIIK